MWLTLRTAWRNLFRQRRRTAITVSAMAVSLAVAIPTYGLMDGLAQEMLRGITGMDLGHVQVHDPAYPQGKTLQSTLRQPDRLLGLIRGTPGVRAAAPRVHGYALASSDQSLAFRMQAPAAAPGRRVLGRAIDPAAPWRADPSVACEVLVEARAARQVGMAIGSALTPDRSGAATRAQASCERLRVVGLLAGGADVSTPGALALWIAPGDRDAAFGDGAVTGRAVLRHSAAVSLEGVDPGVEPKVTFMAKKVVEGRYLAPAAAGEVVVGYRLARILGLKVGGKVFVQAGSLDQTTGSYYQDLLVVGVYRTGVDLVDRSRVFVHLEDAQRLLSLEGRLHEVAVVGTEPKENRTLARRLGRSLDAMRLSATTTPRGLRAGSQPLPAPVTVVQPEGDTVALVIPYDLRRRLEDLPAVAQVGQRVYGQVSAAPARAVTVPLRAHRAAAFAAATGGPAPADRCGAVAAGATGLAVGQRLVRAGTAPGDEGCPAYVVARVTATADASGAGLHVLRPDGDDDDAPAEGPMSLLAAEATTSLRFVGVEPAVEARLSALPGHLAAGAVLGETLPGAADEASWPVLLTERAARRLQVGVGASLLLSTRDAERRVGQHPAQVVGLLRDATWPADRPELVLPVFPAQQIDLPLLNARAHELVLVPRPGQDLTALARAAEAQFVPLVRPWQTITPDLAKMLATQDTMMVVLLVIIFAIAAITVMNTMLMAVYERTREFGVLKSLGMLPRQVFALIVVETLLVALFAILIGCSVGLGINHYLEVKGLDLTSITGGFTYQGAFIDPVWRAVLTARTLFLPPLLVTLVCLVVSFYPALRASRLKPVEAFRHTT